SILLDYYAKYSSDLNIWFDNVSFRISSSTSKISASPTTRQLLISSAQIEPITHKPEGHGYASQNDPKRNRKRITQRAASKNIVDPRISSDCEDYVEKELLIPNYSNNYVRVGHRGGEMLRLDDGYIPGADFYVTKNNNPIKFIEVKSVSSQPPVKIHLTRGEYYRICNCFKINIPYTLVLVNVQNYNLIIIPDIAPDIEKISLSEVAQFVIQINPSSK
ncbi:hypothetical protein KKB99_05630, partial [bacterium]|nr:hypothetical protein [bacterium]MBU1025473.1 hypothetical protein [bacterium]